MDTPQFTDGEFVNATLLNSAMTDLISTIAGIGQFLHTPGLLNPSTLAFTPSALVVSISAPDPFAVLFGNGRLADAHGTVDGADTTTYSVNMASLVPGSGSVTAYIVASFTTIGDDLVTVVGPPQGHPDYNPNFAPFQFYSSEKASLLLGATTAVPDNETTFELCRITLTAGQGSIQPNQIIITHQVYASAVLNPTGVAAGTYAGATITVGKDGRITSASTVDYGPLAANNVWTGSNLFDEEISAAAGVVSSGIDAGGGGGQFRATSAHYAAMLRNDDTNVYLLQTASGSPGGGFNAFRPFSWNLANGAVTIDGTGVGTNFGGIVTVKNPAGQVVGLSIDGSGNNPYGGNLLLRGAGGSKSIRVANSNALQVVNSAYSQVIFTLDDAGNLTTTGTASIGGALTAGAGGISTTGNIAAGQALSGLSVASSNGNVTANNGRLRAAFGAFGSGDSNAAALLSDFPVTKGSPGIQTLPSGLMVQWFPVGLPANKTPTIYNLPFAFPNAMLAIVGSYGAETPPDTGNCGFQVQNNAQYIATNTNPGGGTNGCNVIAIGF